nr:WAT1-related protein At5g40210-like isoform X1 [Ipomoea batatas]
MMSKCMEKAFPFVVMVLVVLSQVANLIVSKMAMSRGLSFFILALYGDLLSTLISLPFAFIFSRSNNFPVTFAVLCKIFLLALVGCVGQICEFAGTKYGSPTLATAMLTLVPGLTFVLALILRFSSSFYILLYKNFTFKRFGSNFPVGLKSEPNRDHNYNN